MKFKYLFLSILFLFLVKTRTNGQNYSIYVSDAGNFQNPPWQILRFDQDGTNPTVFINERLNWPQDILFLEEKSVVLISNFGSNQINLYNSNTGKYLKPFAINISAPTRMKIGPDGLIYVLQWGGTGRVKRYDLEGNYIDDFTKSGVPQSIGLDWDNEGNLYVSSYYLDLVKKFDQNGEDLGNFISDNLQGPTNIWFDENKDLLVIDYDGNSIKRFDRNGNFVNNFIQGVNKGEGYAIMETGNILIGNGAKSSVGMYDAAGNFIKTLISSGAGNLITPNAVVLREEKVVTNTIDNETLSLNIFYPSIGNTFHLNKEFQKLLVDCNIYNSHGVNVMNYNLQFGGFSTLTNLQSGTYIAVAKLRNGSNVYQRIIVQ